jgi:hypothetical protein
VSQTRCGPVCDEYLSLSNGVAILIEEPRRGSATRSAIAETGAMLLNGQGRASASKSAVACRTGSLLRSHARRPITKFLVSSDGPVVFRC